MIGTSTHGTTSAPGRRPMTKPTPRPRISPWRTLGATGEVNQLVPVNVNPTGVMRFSAGLGPTMSYQAYSEASKGSTDMSQPHLILQLIRPPYQHGNICPLSGCLATFSMFSLYVHSGARALHFSQSLSTHSSAYAASFKIFRTGYVRASACHC